MESYWLAEVWWQLRFGLVYRMWLRNRPCMPFWTFCGGRPPTIGAMPVSPCQALQRKQHAKAPLPRTRSGPVVRFLSTNHRRYLVANNYSYSDIRPGCYLFWSSQAPTLVYMTLSIRLAVSLVWTTISRCDRNSASSLARSFPDEPDSCWSISSSRSYENSLNVIMWCVLCFLSIFGWWS